MPLLVNFLLVCCSMGAFSFILAIRRAFQSFRARLGQETEVMKKTKTARLGFLQTLQQLSSLVLNRGKPNYEISTELHAKLGNLMIIDLPFKKQAMLSLADQKIAKQIMSSVTWLNRIPHNHYMHIPTFNKETGILFASGEAWKQARALTIKLLHQLNFYKLDRLEGLILTEFRDLEQNLTAKIEKNGGKVVLCPHHMFERYTVNIVSQVLMSQRFKEGDPVLETLVTSFNKFNREFNIGYTVLELFSWLRHVPGLTFFQTYERTNRAYNKIFQGIVNERRRAGTYKTEPADFIDHFLAEIDRREDDLLSCINDECLLVTLRDMVWAGSDTSNSTLEHVLLHMSLHPDIQSKVQAEIDEVIGPHRPAQFNDRLKMPYTQAVLLEILRHATPVPFASRSPETDTKINDDHVPEGSLLGINLYAIHRSDEVWEDPYEFKPERFLGPNNEVINTEKIMPFGHGKRMCLGETVGRTTLFIFLVSLMQKFTFRVSQDHPPPSLNNIPGLTRCPLPYYVKIQPRIPESRKSTPDIIAEQQ